MSVSSKLMIAFGFLALESLTPALADWKFCNKTAKTAFVAVAFDNGDGFQSVGWSHVPACGCTSVLAERPKLRGAFFSAQTQNNEITWKGDTEFCVGSTDFAFKRENRDRAACAGRGGHLDGFIQTNLTTDNFTTNLRGEDPSGRRCF